MFSKLPLLLDESLNEWQLDLMKELFPQIVHDTSYGQPPRAVRSVYCDATNGYYQ
jgi:hypothetical protein